MAVSGPIESVATIGQRATVVVRSEQLGAWFVRNGLGG